MADLAAAEVVDVADYRDSGLVKRWLAVLEPTVVPETSADHRSRVGEELRACAVAESETD